jgi:acyl carrier protein
MDTMTDTIREMVIAVTGLPPKDIRDDANLYLDLGVASAHALQLLAELEERFQVAVPDDEFVDATSIHGLAALIHKLTASKGPACV